MSDVQLIEIIIPAPIAVIDVVTGLQGLPGTNGVSSSPDRIDQIAASASWILNHSKGRIPIVQVFSSSGEWLGADVTCTSTQINVVFAQATSGFVLVS